MFYLCLQTMRQFIFSLAWLPDAGCLLSQQDYNAIKIITIMTFLNQRCDSLFPVVFRKTLDVLSQSHNNAIKIITNFSCGLSCAPIASWQVNELDLQTLPFRDDFRAVGWGVAVGGPGAGHYSAAANHASPARQLCAGSGDKDPRG